MIFFNVTQAREQLLDKGVVYTLRSSTRPIGKTVAVQGNYYAHTKLCNVEVTRIADIRSPDDLLSYLQDSGFGSTFDWMKAASLTARTLYKVTTLSPS